MEIIVYDKLSIAENLDEMGGGVIFILKGVQDVIKET